MSNNSLIGRTLANFKISRLLGHGGMADVYYGTDIKLHRPVAIKVFDVHTRSQVSQINRFLQEARMMAQWRHNNIVQIYYADDATGLSYYVMEFIDGYDLASIMSVYAEKGELAPFADVLRIGDAVANALDYAHAQGVIHRDVKPANVLIANDGRVVLGDFGLALDLRDKSHGEVFGSPHYISPEQARRSSDAVAQSDLYSLGVILYEMLTGAAPFNDPSPASLALQHITEPPPAPRTINPALSEEVERVLLKALEKKPKDRFQSGKSLMEAMREALTPKPVAFAEGAPPLPPIPVGAPTIQRSDISLNSFTRRGDVISALEHRTASKPNIEAILPAPRAPSRFGWALLFVFLLLAFGCVASTLNPNWLAFLGPAMPTSTSPNLITNTARVLVQNPTVDAQTPQLLFTQTLDVPSTITPTKTPTLIPTATVSLTVTAVVTALPTIATTPTVRYPFGYWMTAFYNASSFYILDRGEASRSTAGFSFERILPDGTFQNYFDGWEWEMFFEVIQPARCISLELYPPPVPYLQPVECEKRVLSRLQLSAADARAFWIPSDNSQAFRVMWLDEEIARCQIEAGTCDFYVP